jgi:hypothetical protein
MGLSQGTIAFLQACCAQLLHSADLAALVALQVLDGDCGLGKPDFSSWESTDEYACKALRSLRTPIATTAVAPVLVTATTKLPIPV